MDALKSCGVLENLWFWIVFSPWNCKIADFRCFFLILTIFPTSKTRSRPKTQDLKNRCLSIGTIRKLHQLAKFGYSKCYKSQEVDQNYNSQFEKIALFQEFRQNCTTSRPKKWQRMKFSLNPSGSLIPASRANYELVEALEVQKWGKTRKRVTSNLGIIPPIDCKFSGKCSLALTRK